LRGYAAKRSRSAAIVSGASDLNTWSIILLERRWRASWCAAILAFSASHVTSRRRVMIGTEIRDLVPPDDWPRAHTIGKLTARPNGGGGSGLVATSTERRHCDACSVGFEGSRAHCQPPQFGIGDPMDVTAGENPEFLNAAGPRAPPLRPSQGREIGQQRLAQGEIVHVGVGLQMS
jgi:hypothetical protein